MGRVASTFTLLAMLLAGCETVQTTRSDVVGVDREQKMFMLLSSEQMNEMYYKSYLTTLVAAEKSKKWDHSSADYKRLRAIANRLVEQAIVLRPDAGKWKWAVNLIKNDQLNANCGPGGKIIVYSGLITKLKLKDDELAAVLGHEIAHALREHGREAMGEALAAKAAHTGAGLLGLGQLGVVAADTLVQYGMTYPNSRRNENEADLLGLELSARAGFDPQAAITLWQKMVAANGAGGMEFLSTHPAAQSRIEALQATIPKVMPLYLAARKP